MSIKFLTFNLESKMYDLGIALTSKTLDYLSKGYSLSINIDSSEVEVNTNNILIIVEEDEQAIIEKLKLDGYVEDISSRSLLKK
jgi:hypothetical protein